MTHESPYREVRTREQGLSQPLFIKETTFPKLYLPFPWVSHSKRKVRKTFEKKNHK